MQQPVGLRLKQTADGYARPDGNQRGNLVLPDGHFQLLIGQPRVALGYGSVLDLEALGAEFGRELVIRAVGCGLLLVLKLSSTPQKPL